MAGRAFEHGGQWFLRVTVPRSVCISGRSADRRAQRKIGPKAVAVAWGVEVDGLIAAAREQGQRVRATDLIRQAGLNLRGRLPGASPDPATLTVADYAPSWLSTVTGSTRRLYDSIYRKHIAPTFGALPLSHIRPRLVREWLQGVERDVADSTARTIFAALSSMLSQAVRDEELRRHPAPSLRSIRPQRRTQKRDKPVLSLGQIDAVVDAVREIEPSLDKRLLVELQAVTGCRAGEALGMQWADLEGNRLRICRQVYEGRVCPTKNRRSRSVTLTPTMLAQLRRHRAAQQERALARGRRAGPWICQTSTGRHYSYASLLRVWRSALEAAGIIGPKDGLAETGMGSHVLRHSSVTHKLAAGRNPADVAAWHGMSMATMHRDYAHAIPSNQDAMATDFGGSGQRVGNLGDSGVSGRDGDS